MPIPSWDFERNITKHAFQSLNTTHYSNSQIQLLSYTLDSNLADYENKILSPSNYVFNSGVPNISPYTQSFSSLFLNVKMT